MSRQRITYALLNIKWTLLMNVVLLVINFFSRSIFLEYLGATLVGLTGTMVSYIGFLNLMDLGIGTAVIQALYKPISQKDHDEIKRISSLFGFMFRVVGTAVGVCGVVLSLFFPVIFDFEEVECVDVYAAFYTYLLMTLMSYFINYRQTMLIADQKNFLITRSYNIILSVKYVLQMSALVVLNLGFLSWLCIEFLAQVFYVFLLERKINREYPWLNTSVSEGYRVRKEYPQIFKNIKRIFSSRIAGVGLAQSDKIIIQNMLSLSDVANFENYTIITGRIVRIIASMFSSTYGSVGNIIATNDTMKARLVFRQLMAMYFFGAGVLAFGFATFANSFITLWLADNGVKYSQIMVLLIAANMFIAIVRVTYDSFINAYGLFGDYPSAWAELIANIFISIILTYYYGLIGVVIGTTVSTFVIGLIWKPYYLFSRGFHKRVYGHYLQILEYLLIIACSWIFTCHLFDSFIEKSFDGWISWIIGAFAATAFFSVVLLMALYLTSSGMRELWKVAVDILKKRTS